MKTKLLLIIISTIFLLGVLIAGGVLITERNTTITAEDKAILIAKDIYDFKTTELKCKNNYCTFWIVKEGYINSEQKIDNFYNQCSYTKINGGEENKTCVLMIKTEAQLITEKNSITDELISKLAQNIKTETKSSTTIGTEEKIIIGVKK